MTETTKRMNVSLAEAATVIAGQPKMGMAGGVPATVEEVPKPVKVLIVAPDFQRVITLSDKRDLRNQLLMKAVIRAAKQACEDEKRNRPTPEELAGVAGELRVTYKRDLKHVMTDADRGLTKRQRRRNRWR